MIDVIKIKQEKNPYLINESLIHWTGRGKSIEDAFDNLTKIVESSSLRLSRNPINEKRTNTTVETSMICFTDIPIEKSSNHCLKYGFIGIGFKKGDLIHYGANPVLYYVKERNDFIDFFDDSIFFGDIGILDDDGYMSWIRSVFQPYDNGHQEYYEREWRINRILPMRNAECIDKHKKLIDSDRKRFKGDIIRVDNEEKSDNDMFFMEFDKAIIDCIIVPETHIEQAYSLINKNKIDCKLIIIKQ
ncbi:MAG: abortive infection system antitoxin AbiGi family protein [Bacteroidota bacterium]